MLCLRIENYVLRLLLTVTVNYDCYCYYVVSCVSNGTVLRIENCWGCIESHKKQF